MRQLRRDKILRDVLGLGQGKRGLARLGLVSLETVLAQLIEEPGAITCIYFEYKKHKKKVAAPSTLTFLLLERLVL